MECVEESMPLQIEHRHQIAGRGGGQVTAVRRGKLSEFDNEHPNDHTPSASHGMFPVVETLPYLPIAHACMRVTDGYRRIHTASIEHLKILSLEPSFLFAAV